MFGASFVEFFALILATSFAVRASAVTGIADGGIEERQFASIFNSIASGAASIATQDIPGPAATVISDGTRALGGVTSEGGKVYTVISSLTSDVEKATSLLGSMHTAVVSASKGTSTSISKSASASSSNTTSISSSNAALGVSSLTVKSSVLIQVVMVIFGAIFGAYITL